MARILFTAFVYLTALSSLFIFVTFLYLEDGIDTRNWPRNSVERRALIHSEPTSTKLPSFISSSGYRLLSVLQNEQGYQSALVEIQLYDVVSNFEKFDNTSGVAHLIVPNIIHYVQFNRRSFKFFEYVAMRSAYLQQQPDYIFIHTNIKSGFKGKYWNWILNEEDFSSRIVILLTEAPTEIFGKPLNPDFALHHGSDITRIRALMAYGGIFT